MNAETVRIAKLVLRQMAKVAKRNGINYPFTWENLTKANRDACLTIARWHLRRSRKPS